MKKAIGIIMLAIAGLMILNVGLISAHESNAVSGTVTDATTGAPIEGALVAVEVEVDDVELVLTGETDPDGQYMISDVPAGHQTFTASADGYDDETVGAAVSETNGATVNFTLQPWDEELELEELEDNDEGGKVAGTRRGYVGIFAGATAAVTGAVTSSATLTTPTTGAATEGYFMVDTKQGMIKIHTPSAGIESVIGGFESFTQTAGRPSQIPTDGDRVVVLVEFVDQNDGELAKVAVWVKVKPTKAQAHIVGDVVGVRTDEDGVRTVSIMRGNGTTKVLQLGPDAELPDVGDLVTAFQGRGRGGNGPSIATGIVPADNVRQRLEGFLEDLTGDEGELSSKAAERVAKIAAILEKHAAKQVEIIEQVSLHENLPPQALQGIQHGLDRAKGGLVEAKAKGAQAKDKAGRPSDLTGRGQDGPPSEPKDQNQGGRGNRR